MDNPKKYKIAVRIDADLKIALLEHKAATGETISEYITRLIREDVGKKGK